MYYFYHIKDGKCLYKNLFQFTKKQFKYANNVIETTNKIKLKKEQDKKGKKKVEEQKLKKL